MPPPPPMVQMAPVVGAAPAIDLAMLVAALREAAPPPPQPQAEVAQSFLAISQTLSDKIDSCRSSSKRVRSRSPSPASSPLPPSEKRSRAKSRSRSRSRLLLPSRSGRSSPTSSQFSDQSEDEAVQQVETLDLGIPPLSARSALDHELLTTEDEVDPIPAAAPVVAPA